MTRWIVPPIEGLIEPAIAPEFMVDDVGAIELIGEDQIRIYHYSRQRLLEDPDRQTFVVAVKIRQPIAVLPRRMARMAECLAGNPPLVGAAPWTPRIVR